MAALCSPHSKKPPGEDAAALAPLFGPPLESAFEEHKLEGEFGAGAGEFGDMVGEFGAVVSLVVVFGAETGEFGARESEFGAMVGEFRAMVSLGP